MRKPGLYFLSICIFFLSGVILEYLCAVLSDVLHCQREPLPLCLALLQYDKELVSSQLSALPHPSIISLHEYYSKWLPRQCQEELVSFVNKWFVKLLIFNIISYHLITFASQFKSSEGCSGELSSPTSFTALMKAAYNQGMATLLKDAFRKKVEETISSMSLAEYPVAVKQILLYIKSTLENVGTVRAQHNLSANLIFRFTPNLSCGCKIHFIFSTVP